MATLTDDVRKQVWAEFMRELSNNHEPIDLSKQELYNAIAIVDENMDEIVELLRSHITSKAQASLVERVWLQIIAKVVIERQQHEFKNNPPPKFAIAGKAE